MKTQSHVVIEGNFSALIAHNSCNVLKRNSLLDSESPINFQQKFHPSFNKISHFTLQHTAKALRGLVFAHDPRFWIWREFMNSRYKVRWIGDMRTKKMNSCLGGRACWRTVWPRLEKKNSTVTDLIPLMHIQSYYHRCRMFLFVDHLNNALMFHIFFHTCGWILSENDNLFSTKLFINTGKSDCRYKPF